MKLIFLKEPMFGETLNGPELHGCTVVGNPGGGGGPWGFGQIVLRGVLWVVRKSRGFCVLFHFYATIFRTLRPSPLPLCASMLNLLASGHFKSICFGKIF